MGRIFGVVGPAADGIPRDWSPPWAGIADGPSLARPTGPGAVGSSGAVLYGQDGGQCHRSEDGRHVCLWDGQLVPADRLVRHLAGHGFTAEGGSIGEVLLSAYAHHGAFPLKFLRGSFALAIYDTLEQVLFLAADPYGQKRLFVAESGGSLVFSSDLGALAGSGLSPLSLSDEGLTEYLSFGYIHPPLTIYKGVSSLCVGEFLAWEEGKSHRSFYHQVIGDRWAFADVAGRTEEDLIDELEKLTSAAILDRIPAGCRRLAVYLSSGLDTGFLAASLRRHWDGEPVAFTLGSEHPRHDEVPGARKMAGFLGLGDHRCVYMTQDDCYEALEQLPHVFGQPMADLSAIPNLVITREVGREFTEIFAGDGPDGLYGNWDLRPWYQLYRWVPYLVRMPLALLADRLDRTLGLGLSTPSRQIADLLTQPEFSWVFHKKLKSRDLERLLGRVVPPETFAVHRYLRDRRDIPLYERLRMGFALYFVMHGVLLKSGTIHNAVGVEQICPYYDRALVDFICALPTRYKIRGKGYGKYLHTRLLERYVPPEVWRGRKRGFIFDFRSFDLAPLRSLTARYLDRGRLLEAGLFDPDFVGKSVDAYFKGDDRAGPAILTLLIFEMWRDRYLP